MKKKFYLLSVILISCLGITIYSNTFHCSFHFDDQPHIIQNFAIKDFYNLQSIWHYYHTRFITFLSLAFNYHLSGLNVFSYHIFNLSVHLISAILVWWLVLLTLSTSTMKEDKITAHAHLIALFAGLVFVSHPVQTEAVTYIWERAASLMAMFYLACLCFYVKSRLLQANDPRSSLHKFYYILSLITAIAAMFTKENAITLPLMILFYEFCFFEVGAGLKPAPTGLNWSSCRTLVVTRRYLFPFLLTIFIMPLTLLFSNSQIFQEHHGILRVAGGVITPMNYFLTQFRAMFTYVRLVFLPFHQNLDYDYPLFKSIFELPVLISLLSLIAIFYWTKSLFFKYRLISFSIFWFFFTLTIPESSFWALGDLIFEHRLYLPLVGYSIFLVSGLFYLTQKNSVKTMVIILTMIIICNSVLTYQRNKIWKNDLTLWTDAIQKSPHKARPHTNRGIFYATQKEFPQAISDFTKAIGIAPDDAKNFYNRGNAYIDQHNLPLALLDYTKAIEINPDFVEAYFNRSYIYNTKGDFTQALSDCTRAIQINPNFAYAYLNLSLDYYLLRNYEKAWADVRKAEKLGISPDPGFINILKKASRINK